MFNSLSGVLAHSPRKQESKAAETAHQSHVAGQFTSQYPCRRPPQVTLPGDRTHYDDDSVPQLDCTAGFANLSISDEPSVLTPSVDETVAHLKTLECFYRLRQTIGSTDGLFGISNAVVKELAWNSARANSHTVDELFPKLAEKRWAIYVSRAVDRFHLWVKAVVPVSSMPTMSRIERYELDDLVELDHARRRMGPIERANMLPADVLMVWHAYMLNPRAYLEDCIRLGRMSLYQTKMPWDAIAHCIDSSTFGLQPGHKAADSFTRLTGCPWENLEDATAQAVSCPECKAEILVPLTTCLERVISKTKPSNTLVQNVEACLASGNGFADRDFSTTCRHCGTTLKHETLRAGKFCTDLERLLSDKIPMPGTVLGPHGLPFRIGIIRDVKWRSARRKTNDLLRLGLGQRILDQPRSNGNGQNESIARIRDTISETILKDHSYMRRVRGDTSSRMTPIERLGIRKMMSRYWNNSSPFALDLVGAVIRQGNFVEKMHNIDWLHSPALHTTISRLLLRYERFIDLIGSSKRMAVPTLDIDLAWHTHQLNPRGYLKHVVGQTSQLVDHDDKVLETVLNDAFVRTSKAYEKRYSEKYSICACWYCEAIQERNTSAAWLIFASRGKSILHNIEQDSKKPIHISAHNAVRPTDSAKYTSQAQAQANQLEQAYRKACIRARKEGTPEPIRDDYYWSTAYGYPLYIPEYAPHVYMPYTPALYAATPGCMSLSKGDRGSCAVGTCSGTVSAGSCSAGQCAGSPDGQGSGGGCGGGGCGGGGCGSGGGC